MAALFDGDGAAHYPAHRVCIDEDVAANYPAKLQRRQLTKERRLPQKTSAIGATIYGMNSDDDLPLFSQLTGAPQGATAPVTHKRREAGDARNINANNVIAVSELNRRARQILEGNLELLWVSGELSNVMRAASGHYYFSLKDDQAQVRCVMFRQRASTISFTPENGMQVEVRALPSLYEARGEFQLGVETMRRAGLGALFEAYERLKARLAAAGLFDEARRKPLPFFPKTIGIVTSLQAAALRDVMTTLARRAPMISVILYPTLVQGSTAATDIARAVDLVRTREEVDVLIICRGGGSIEDLWSFNEETVARAIIRLQKDTMIPVVSGVGHETDFTICDFIADQRAPTPTAAAELVSPDTEQLRTQVANVTLQWRRNMLRKLEALQQHLDHATRGLLSPTERLARTRERLHHAAAQIDHAMRSQLDRCNHQWRLNRQRFFNARPDIEQRSAQLYRRRDQLKSGLYRLLHERKNSLDQARRNLNLLSPGHVLERGYSIVEFEGSVLRDAGAVAAGDVLAIRLAKGRVKAQVAETNSD